MTSKIDWKGYFDKIYCIHFLPDKNRIPRLEKELERVGILDSGIFQYFYTVPNRYEKIYEKIFPECRPVYMNLGFGTLKMLKEAMYLDYGRIMVIEDDIAFLKDMDEMKRILDNMPEEHRMIQMDKAMWRDQLKSEWEPDLEKNKINDHFVSTKNHYVFATCNIYDREGIRDSIAVLEKRICAPDDIPNGYVRNHAVAIRNLAIQVTYSNAANLYYGDVDKLRRKYLATGVRFEDYAIPENYDGRIALRSSLEDTPTVLQLNGQE